MITLYYTGAIAHKGLQANAILSLGGNVSKNIVANDQIDALFGGISQNTLLEGSEEYRCIAFVNEGGSAKQISLYYNNLSIDPVSSFKMAIVAPAINNCNEPVFQKTASVFSKPMLSFTDNRGSSNPLNFTIEPNQVLGLWIQRIVQKAQGEKYLSCESLLSRYDAVDSVQIEAIEFNDNQVQGTYWTLNTINSSIIISYKALDIVGDKEIIVIDVDSITDIQQIIDITIIKLNSILEPRGECVSSTFNGKLIVTQMIAGKSTPSITNTTPINIQTTQGTSSVNESIESLEICIDY